MASIKYEAIRLISRLPEQVSWDDILYELYVRKKIESGITAANDGKTIPHDQVLKWLLGNVSD